MIVKKKITDATETTVRVLQKNKSEATKHVTVQEMVHKETRKEVQNISKSKKKVENKQAPKNLCWGAESQTLTP